MAGLDQRPRRAQHELCVARLIVSVPVFLMVVGYAADIVMAATHQL